jgi:hypothetical protein
MMVSKRQLYEIMFSYPPMISVTGRWVMSTAMLDEAIGVVDTDKGEYIPPHPPNWHDHMLLGAAVRIDDDAAGITMELPQSRPEHR